MLRKRSRSSLRNQEKGHITSLDTANLYSEKTQKPSPNFFNVPGLILGMTPKCVLDCDSIRSPTSPLDFKIFTNLESSLGYPKHELHNKCWECSAKVGLGIVDSLGHDDDEEEICDGGKAVKSSSNGKNVLFGMQVRNKNPEPPLHSMNVPPAQSSPKSFLKNNPVLLTPPRPMKSSDPKHGSKTEVLFQIGEDVLEPDPSQSFSVNKSGSPYIHHHLAVGRVAGFDTTIKRTCLVNEFVHHQLIMDSEKQPLRGSHHQPVGIELSEDYTCVISRGPNPKTTHIYGDRILEGHYTTSRTDSGAIIMQTNGITPVLEQQKPPAPLSSPSKNFLSFCHFCNKKLEEGRDIYMYRGEKAFCSFDCRSAGILIEEEKEKISAQAPGRFLETEGIEEEHDDII